MGIDIDIVALFTKVLQYLEQVGQGPDNRRTPACRVFSFPLEHTAQLVGPGFHPAAGFQPAFFGCRARPGRPYRRWAGEPVVRLHPTAAKMREMYATLGDYLAESAALLTAAAVVGQPAVDAAVDAIVRALSAGKPLLVCGNGGSACDAMHITGELVARFLEERRALKAICLSGNPAVLTAWSNDRGFCHRLRPPGGSLRRTGRRPLGHQHIGQLGEHPGGFRARAGNGNASPSRSPAKAAAKWPLWRIAFWPFHRVIPR